MMKIKDNPFFYPRVNLGFGGKEVFAPFLTDPFLLMNQYYRYKCRNSDTGVYIVGTK